MPALTVERATSPPRPEEKPYGRFGQVILDFFKYRGRESVLEGPADTGKSRAALELVHGCCEKYPGCQWAVVRKTRASITETAQKTYERWVRPDGASRLWHDLEYRYPNGSAIILAGLDEPTRLLSSEFDGIYVMQAEEVDQDDWELTTTRCTGRGAVMPYTRLIADMNPTFPDFHLYQRESRGQVTFFKVRHSDNPTITEERLAPLRALTGYRLRRLYYGERVAAEGMYFTDWDPATHVVEPFPIPAHWTRWTSTDYGYAAPFCHLAFARDPSTRLIYVHREIYAAGLHDHQQADQITARIREERENLKVAAGASLYSLHVGDPSMFAKRTEVNLPSIASVYQARGVKLEPGTNNRKHGWSVVRRSLVVDGDKPSRLRVFRTCTNLIRTLPAMVVDPLDQEDLADAIKGKKTEDHPVDALRYGLVAEASPPAPAAAAAQFGR